MPPGFRCSDAARDRGDAPAATAFPASRLLLVELAGPWPRQAPVDSWPDRSGLTTQESGALHRRAAEAGVRVLAIRRPESQALAGVAHLHRWARVDLTPGATATEWGEWETGADLLALDPKAPVPTTAAGARRPTALVCTHGGHDACCAIRGRPVHAALAEHVRRTGARLDVWECSHVGGDRFAANVLLLPDGLMFGGLDPENVAGVVEDGLAGRLSMPHFRGRCGTSIAAQAAEHHARTVLGEDRLHTPDGSAAVQVTSLRRLSADPVRWTADVRTPAGDHRLTMVVEAAPPTRLTCSATRVGAQAQFRLEGFGALAPGPG